LYTKRLMPQTVFYQQSGMVHLAAITRLAECFAGVVARGLATACIQQAITAAEASELCGIQVNSGGLWLPWVGYCQPFALCQQWAMRPGIFVHCDAIIIALHKCNTGWKLVEQTGKQYTFDQVVIANSFAAK